MIMTKETQAEYKNSGFYNSLNGIGIANGVIAITISSFLIHSIPLIIFTTILTIAIGTFYFMDYSIINGVRNKTTESGTYTVDVEEVKTQKALGKTMYILNLSTLDSNGEITNGLIRVDKEDLEKIHDNKITFTAQKCEINFLKGKLPIFLDVQFIEPSLV